MTRQQALEQFEKETESLLMEGKAEYCGWDWRMGNISS